MYRSNHRTYSSNTITIITTQYNKTYGNNRTTTHSASIYIQYPLDLHSHLILLYNITAHHKVPAFITDLHSSNESGVAATTDHNVDPY
jgi:hypothetical protein